MLRIGITGCIGSGKSTVTRIFSELGVPVYIADMQAKSLMENDPLVRSQLTDTFGSESFTAGGTLNRPYLAGRVFNDEAALAQLNGIVHPAVHRDFETWCALQTNPYVIKEAALMFESGSHRQVNEVIMVTASESLRINRTMQRDGLTEDQVRARMRNQLSESEKLSRAQYQIINDESQLVIPQVLRLHQRFLAEATRNESHG